MQLKKKLSGLLIAALCLLPSLGQAYTIQDNLDVRGNIVGGVRRIGETNNLTLSLASGILKIQCGNADCSASNPGWITLPSNTAGQMVTYKITSSPQFGDATAGDSDFVGTGTCSWGTTAAVAWGNAMPLLLVAAHNGTTVVFGMARGPVLTTGASTNIGYQDNCPSSASQNNVIFMTSTNVTSSHANKRAFPIGAVRATKNASDNYTFTALDDGDGISNFYNYLVREYDFPEGQNGAAAGTWFSVVSGTAPTYTGTKSYKYKIYLSGDVKISVYCRNTSGGTAGAGTNSLNLHLPFKFGSVSTERTKAMAYVKNGTAIDAMAIVEPFGNLYAAQISYMATVPAGIAFVQGAHQNNVTRSLDADVIYSAFK